MWQNNINATYFILAVFGIWLLLLTFWLFKKVSGKGKLYREENQLDRVLQEITAGQKEQNKDIVALFAQLAELGKKQKKSFQKFSLVRFNPFEDTGGDQSFALALLDEENNGIVISSLHSRGSTRIYAKSVSNAKSTAHQFSKEEKEVVDKAARQV